MFLKYTIPVESDFIVLVAIYNVLTDVISFREKC